MHLGRTDPSAPLEIRAVATRGDRRAFLEFPWKLYRGDPLWTPPLRVMQRELVGYGRHPFYERNRAQTFLALRGGTVCGRIAAIVNEDHNQRHRDRLGFFGFFECRDDPEAAAGLFAAAREWLTGQGLRGMRGPANPSVNYSIGLLVDGFDRPPTFLLNYNRPYYAQLVEACGFKGSQDLFSYEGTIDMLPPFQQRYLEIVEHMIEEYRIRLRPLDRSHFLADVEAFLEIYNRSLANTWSFVPITGKEMRRFAEELRWLLIPELCVIAEIDGRMVAAAFGLPDYNPRVRAVDGRLFPFGWLRLLWRKQAIRRARLISTNVLPEYQSQGIGLALLHGLVPQVLRQGIQSVEFSWVMESNRLSRGSLERGGLPRIKTHRMYDLLW